MAQRKFNASAVKKSHKIAKALMRDHGFTPKQAFAIGVATEKKHLAKMRRKRK